MAKPVVQFTTEGNWQQVYEERRVCTFITDKVFNPIPAFEVGFLFDTHIIAIRAISTSAKSTWRYAGSLHQRLQLGTGGALSNLPEVDLSNRGILLNRTTLIDLPAYTPEYALVFQPPTWMQDIRITFWQYSGINSDSVSDTLAAARDDLARIEMKIDNNSGL